MKYPISEAARAILQREECEHIGYGFAGWLDEIYDKLRLGRQKHPLNKWAVVLNGLDREIKSGCKLFEKSFITMPSGREARVFVLKSDKKGLFNEDRHA